MLAALPIPPPRPASAKVNLNLCWTQTPHRRLCVSTSILCSAGQERKLKMTPTSCQCCCTLINPALTPAALTAAAPTFQPRSRSSDPNKTADAGYSQQVHHTAVGVSYSHPAARLRNPADIATYILLSSGLAGTPAERLLLTLDPVWLQGAINGS